MKPPWFFCCGWWSPWCVLDEFAHRWLFKTDAVSVQRMPGVFGWICDRHEHAITKHFETLGGPGDVTSGTATQQEKHP